jgi:hypothetical protein
MQGSQPTGMVDERPRSSRPRKTSDDRLIARRARRNRFETSARIRDQLNF